MNRIVSITLLSLSTLALLGIVMARGLQAQPPPPTGVPYECNACRPQKCLFTGELIKCVGGPQIQTPSSCTVQQPQPSDGGYVRGGQYQVFHNTLTAGQSTGSYGGARLTLYGSGSVTPCGTGAYRVGYPAKGVLPIYFVGLRKNNRGETVRLYRFSNLETVLVGNPPRRVNQYVTRYVTFQRTNFPGVLYYYAVVWIGLGENGKDADEWWSIVQ